MKSIREKLTEKLPLLVILFCIVQPLLDIIGWWQIELDLSNTFTMIFRMLLLICTVLVGFIISDRKRNYWFLGFALLFLTAGHVCACCIKGYADVVDDLTNLVRIYLLPFTALALIDALKQNDKVFSAMMKGMIINLGIIILVEIVSEITGTDPHTYSYDGIGILGWFFWTNSQSAILAMLTPVSICYTLRRWKDKLWPVIVVSVFSMAALYFLAPRLAYASLVASGLGIPFSIMVTDKTQWKKALSILIVCVIFVGLYPLSPTANRGNVVKEMNKENQMLIDEPEEPENLEGYDAIYRNYLYSVVKRFGLERVVKYYDYTLDVSILDNNRKMKLAFCALEMEDSGIMSHLFGLGINDLNEPIVVFSHKYDRWVDYDDCFDPENDFHGIYYLTGAVGLGMMILFILYFAIPVLVKLIKEPKKYFTLEMAAFGIAFCCAIVHAYCTASILRRNNGSVYFALVLAGLWYLSRWKKYDEPETELPAESVLADNFTELTESENQ